MKKLFIVLIFLLTLSLFVFPENIQAVCRKCKKEGASPSNCAASGSYCTRFDTEHNSYDTENGQVTRTKPHSGSGSDLNEQATAENGWKDVVDNSGSSGSGYGSSDNNSGAYVGGYSENTTPTTTPVPTATPVPEAELTSTPAPTPSGPHTRLEITASGKAGSEKLGLMIKNASINAEFTLSTASQTFTYDSYSGTFLPEETKIYFLNDTGVATDAYITQIRFVTINSTTDSDIIIDPTLAPTSNGYYTYSSATWNLDRSSCYGGIYKSTQMNCGSALGGEGGYFTFFKRQKACASLTADGNIITRYDEINLHLVALGSTTNPLNGRFVYAFYNNDNLYPTPPANNAKPLLFKNYKGDTPAFALIQSNSSNANTLTLTYADLDFIDQHPDWLSTNPGVKNNHYHIVGYLIDKYGSYSYPESFCTADFRVDRSLICGYRASGTLDEFNKWLYEYSYQNNSITPQSSSIPNWQITTNAACDGEIDLLDFEAWRRAWDKKQTPLTPTPTNVITPTSTPPFAPTKTPTPIPSAKNYLVFVTSKTYPANFGGILGARNICQTSAQNAKLSGIFRPLLSSGGINGLKEILASEPSNVPYKLKNGTLIANSYSDLYFNNTLLNKIYLTEYGTTITTISRVWTGAYSNGDPSGNNCNNWTSSSSSYKGTIGDLNKTSTAWINSGTVVACNWQARLYCFQTSFNQPTATPTMKPTATPTKKPTATPTKAPTTQACKLEGQTCDSSVSGQSNCCANLICDFAGSQYECVAPATPTPKVTTSSCVPDGSTCVAGTSVCCSKYSSCRSTERGYQCLAQI